MKATHYIIQERTNTEWINLTSTIHPASARNILDKYRSSADKDAWRFRIKESSNA